jgi:hypothetical protein
MKLILYNLLLLGTALMPIQGCTQKIQKMNYNTLYQNWRHTINAMPHYSKTTAYTQVEEFRELVQQGEGIVSFLEEKLQKNDGLDFVLAIAIVQIKKWDSNKFPATDMTELRKLVLAQLESERKQEKKKN